MKKLNYKIVYFLIKLVKFFYLYLKEYVIMNNNIFFY